MGLFDFIANFDPDEIVKKFDEFEQNLDKALDGVSSAAEKVENAAGVVEKKAGQGGGADPAAATKIQVDEPVND